MRAPRRTDAADDLAVAYAARRNDKRSTANDQTILHAGLQKMMSGMQIVKQKITVSVCPKKTKKTKKRGGRERDREREREARGNKLL